MPSNPKTFPDLASLAGFYDNNAASYFQFFKNSLAQIPCNTTSSARYSLARSCDDCVSAYKDWLCAVIIPRCTDFSSNLPWLQERSVVNPFPNGTTLPADIVDFANNSQALSTSRNPLIDDKVRPGPYKEILPCDDLCYGIVQSCPSSLAFACPLPGRTGFNSSYGTRWSDNDMTCNIPGVSFSQPSNSGSLITAHYRWLFTSLVVAILVSM